MTTVNDIISQTIVKLFESERFYAEIISQMNRVIGQTVPLAGVCIKDKIELHLNDKTFTQMSITERVAILKHECEHLLRDHIPRSKEISPETYKKSKDKVDRVLSQMKHNTINIAADCAINWSLNGLPEGVIYPKIFNLDDGNTMEWYLENLKNNQEVKQLMKFDDHAIWEESELDKDILREKIKKVINEAAKKTRAVGQLTANQELLVQKLNSKTKNWKTELKRFISRNLDINLDTSRKKRNRRYGIQFPGVIKTEILNIGVALDTSGSISDKAIAQFMRELTIMSRYANIMVVEADSEIKNSYVFDPKKTYIVKGRGGTAYKPAFDFFNKMKEIDGVIYFGDMDCCDESGIKKPRYPVLWAIVGTQNPPVSFGQKINIMVEND